MTRTRCAARNEYPVVHPQSVTFRCELERDHDGLHQFTVVWGRPSVPSSILGVERDGQ